MVFENKKGGIQDLFFILVALLFFGMMLLIGFKIVNEFNAEIQADDLFDDRTKTATQKMNDMFPTTMDNAFLYIVIGLCIVTLILAMLVAIHPVFFVFYFILLAIVIFVGGVFSNIYQEMALNPELVSIADQLVFTSHVLYFLPMVIGVFGFILAIVMYRTYQNAT